MVKIPRIRRKVHSTSRPRARHKAAGCSSKVKQAYEHSISFNAITAEALRRLAFLGRHYFCSLFVYRFRTVHGHFPGAEHDMNVLLLSPSYQYPNICSAVSSNVPVQISCFPVIMPHMNGVVLPPARTSVPSSVCATSNKKKEKKERERKGKNLSIQTRI